MATGITKREQISADALSATNFFHEGAALPPDRACVSLTYPNKAPVADILDVKPREYVRLGHSPSMPDALLDNAFVLDDNFFVLNELLRTGCKATLFYLDPPTAQDSIFIPAIWSTPMRIAWGKLPILNSCAAVSFSCVSA